jgi:UDP-N-acetylglucosamine 1-carboxyvinyltransferase
MPEKALTRDITSSAVSSLQKNPSYLLLEQSLGLSGEVSLNGAKNATLVIMTSLILTKGISRLSNVPALEDVYNMVGLLRDLGATVTFVPEENFLEVDTTHLNGTEISSDMMKKMRASILAMGPLLARFGKAKVSYPGGCVLGARPIDYHLKNFEKMGVFVKESKQDIHVSTKKLVCRNLLLEYPSVGATENLVMAATLTEGVTRVINAALEPEVFDFIDVLKKMGAQIEIEVPATIKVTGVKKLNPVEHSIMNDRLEAGSLLLAGAITGGYVSIPEAPAHSMGLFLMKLQEVGHTILIGKNGIGVKIKATKNPQAVSIKTAPYPGYPTDLQAPLMAMLCLARGKSEIHESVFEHRLVHSRELVKMGAQVDVNHDRAVIHGVEELYGANVIASDIRASCALVLAGLAATGTTKITGIHHWKRGYESLEKKLQHLGATIELYEN